jgi:hypothetical protein
MTHIMRLRYSMLLMACIWENIPMWQKLQRQKGYIISQSITTTYHHDFCSRALGYESLRLLTNAEEEAVLQWLDKASRHIWPATLILLQTPGFQASSIHADKITTISHPQSIFTDWHVFCPLCPQFIFTASNSWATWLDSTSTLPCPSKLLLHFP